MTFLRTHSAWQFHLVLGLAALLAAPLAAAERTFDVCQFGAKADGKTLDTAAIQKAVDACAAAGGGSVYVPPGVFRSGTITLKSRVTLWLESGATLLGSDRLDDYPQRRPAIRSYTDNYVDRSLIAGEGLEDVAIRGRGTIDGNGGKFRWSQYLTRPYVIRLVSCRGVLVEGVSMRNSPMWMQQYLACDRVAIRGIRVYNHGGANNDGLDLDGCRDAVVSDCIFDSDDDAITLKSTLDRPCRYVAITNCVAASRCNAIKMGTESNGGFQDITISNCVVAPPRHTERPDAAERGLAGVALEIVDGGRLERVAITNLTMTGVRVPIFMRLGNRARPFEKGGPKPAMGSFRDVILSNVVAGGAAKIGCSITGLPGHPIENVTLRDVHLSFDGGGTHDEAARAIAELPEKYPECTMFGTLPAYGLYCRHVAGLKMSGVRLRFAAAEMRPAVVMDDVQDVAIDGLDAACAPEGTPLLRFVQVRDALVRGSALAGPIETFLQLEGAQSRDVVLTANDLRRARHPVRSGPELPPGALIRP